MNSRQIIHSSIVVEWSDWFSVHESRESMQPLLVQIANGKGVLEFREAGQGELLAISKTDFMRRRLERLFFSDGAGTEHFVRYAGIDDVEVRWGMCARNQEARTVLTGLHIMDFGRFPKMQKR